MRTLPLFAAIIVQFALASCAKHEPGVRQDLAQGPPENQNNGKAPKMKRVRVVIDAKAIATQDAFAIIEPVWFTADIYGSYPDYEASLAKFSRRQRLLVAVSWYAAEVNNGGHGQFYSNSTGIVWEDAHKGFMELAIPDAAKIIAESAKRMGGRPSFNRDERNRVLDKREPTFDELDDRFYKLDVDIDAKMTQYIRAHPKDFLFDGEIER